MTTYTATVVDDLTGATESVHISAQAAYNSLVDYARDNTRHLVARHGYGTTDTPADEFGEGDGVFTEQDAIVGHWTIARTTVEPLILVDSEVEHYRTTVGFDENEIRIRNTWGDLDEPDTHVSVTISRADAVRLVAHLAALLAHPLDAPTATSISPADYAFESETHPH